MSATGQTASIRPGPLTGGYHPEWERVAGLLALLGHPVRVRLLELLAGRPSTGAELAAALGLPQTLVSRQLAVLRLAGLLACDDHAGARRWVLREPSVMDVLSRARVVLRAAAAAEPPDAPRRATEGPDPMTSARPTTDMATDGAVTPGDGASAIAAATSRVPRSAPRLR